MQFKNICLKLVGISLLFVAIHNSFAAEQRPVHIVEDTKFQPQYKKYVRATKEDIAKPEDLGLKMNKFLHHQKFLLHNNSKFTIYCRWASNEEASNRQNLPYKGDIIKPGDFIVLPLSDNYSIKMADSSTMGQYSYFYDVPKPDILATKTYLTDEELRRLSRDIDQFNNVLPIVSITSGITHGWNFKLGVKAH